LGGSHEFPRGKKKSSIRYTEKGDRDGGEKKVTSPSITRKQEKEEREDHLQRVKGEKRAKGTKDIRGRKGGRVTQREKRVTMNERRPPKKKKGVKGKSRLSSKKPGGD